MKGSRGKRKQPHPKLSKWIYPLLAFICVMVLVQSYFAGRMGFGFGHYLERKSHPQRQRKLPYHPLRSIYAEHPRDSAFKRQPATTVPLELRATTANPKVSE